MLGFFNRQSAWKAGLQVVNLAALTLVAYDLYQNPDKLAKNGLDMTVHLVNILCLRENVGALEAFIASNLNSAQVGSLFIGATAGCANLAQPLAATAADVVAHTASGLTIFLGINEEEPDTALKMN